MGGVRERNPMAPIATTGLIAATLHQTVKREIVALRRQARREQRRRQLLDELRAYPPATPQGNSLAYPMLVRTLAEWLRTGPLLATFDELLAMACVLATSSLHVTTRKLRFLLTESKVVLRADRYGLRKLRRNLWTHQETLDRYGLNAAFARHNLSVARRLLLDQARQEGRDRLRALARFATVGSSDAADADGRGSVYETADWRASAPDVYVRHHGPRSR